MHTDIAILDTRDGSDAASRAALLAIVHYLTLVSSWPMASQEARPEPGALDADGKYALAFPGPDRFGVSRMADVVESRLEDWVLVVSDGMPNEPPHYEDEHTVIVAAQGRARLTADLMSDSPDTVLGHLVKTPPSAGAWILAGQYYTYRDTGHGPNEGEWDSGFDGAYRPATPSDLALVEVPRESLFEGSGDVEFLAPVLRAMHAPECPTAVHVAGVIADHGISALAGFWGDMVDCTCPKFAAHERTAPPPPVQSADMIASGGVITP